MTTPANPRFRLDIFEGPLDLLLHLIKKNEVDIHDIPIASITDQYLEAIRFIEDLNLDLAGEYLVMASTLLVVKSRMLLPLDPEAGEEEEDPRGTLVAELEEYQRFREAANRLGSREILARDVFRRDPERPADSTGELPPLRPLTAGDLFEALREVLRRLPDDLPREIPGERLSIGERIPVLLDRLRNGGVEFWSLFAAATARREIVVTFLALLELVRMRRVAAVQAERFGPIWLSLAPDPPDEEIAIRDDYKD